MPSFRAPRFVLPSLLLCAIGLSSGLVGPASAQEKEDAPSRQRNKELWPIFSYKNQQGERRLQVFWPIYESRNDENGSALYLRPFFGHESSSQSDAEYWSFLWPLMASSKDGDQSHTRALPFFWQSRSETHQRRIIAPFYYGERDDAEDRSQGFLAPNFWYQRHGEARSWHVFPFVGYGEDGLRKKHWSALYPLFRGEQDESLGRSRYDIFWPLAGYRNDEFLGSYSWSPLHYQENNIDQSSSLYLPFYGAKRYGPERNVSGVFPFYYYSNHGKNADSKELYTLLFQRSKKDSGASSFSILPFYYQSQDGENGASSRYSPFFYQRRGAESSLGIHPFYYAGSTQNSSYRHLPPFYWSSKDKSTGETSKLIAPFYWGQDSQESSHRALFPFLYYGGKKNGDSRYFHGAPFYWSGTAQNSSYQTLLPFFWNSKSGNRAKTFIAPFYWNDLSPNKNDRVIGPVLSGANISEESSYFHAAPLYWSGQDRDSSYNALAPFYWNWQSKARSKTFLAPFYWNNESATEVDRVIGPIFTGVDAEEQSKYFHIAPFYWSNQTGDDEKSSALLPFYWQSEDQYRKDGVYSPFIYTGYEKSGDSKYLNIAPLYWSGQDRGSSYRTVMPFYWNWQSKARSKTFLAPFYWNNESATEVDRVIGPIFTGVDAEEQSKYFHIAPFYWSNQTGDDQKSSALLPFYWQSEDQYRKDGVYSPFIYSGHNKYKASSYFHIAPFYWSKRTGESGPSSTLIAPFYWNKKDGNGESSFSAPFFYSHKSPESKSSFLPPFYWSSKDGTETDSAYGPFVFTGEDTATQRRYFHAAPFYWHTEQGNPEVAPITTATTIIAPLIYHKETERRKDWAVAPFVFSGEDKENGDSYLHLPPLYWSSRSGDDRKKTTLIAPLYLDMRDGGDSLQSILGLTWTWKEGNKSSYLALPNLYYETRSDGSSIDLTVFPLFGYENKESHKSLSVLWPLMKHKTTDNGYQSWVLPLYYGEKNGDDSFQVAPLFWDSETEDRRKLHLWPFLAYERDSEGGRAYSTLWPLLSYEVGPNRSAFYVRPFYTHLRTESRSINALYPFFYRRQSLDKDTVVGQRFWFLWPIFDSEKSVGESVASSFFYAFRHEWDEKEGTHSQLLWRLYSYEHNQVASSTKINAFYGLFYREHSPELSKLKFRPVFSYETYSNHGGGDYVSFLSGVFSYERFGTDTPEDTDDYRKIRLFGMIVKTIH